MNAMNMEREVEKKCDTGDVVAGGIGALFGAFASFVVTTALVELSFDRWFSLLFGAGFLVLGGVIFARAMSHAAGPTSSPKSRLLLYGFASLILSAGAFCFLVDVSITTEVSVLAKIPMYSLLGIALTFALTFAFIDVLNLFVGVRGYPLVNQTPQVVVLVAGSLLIGLLFGFFFGTLDVEDDDAMHSRLREERHFCTPVAVVVSALVGFAVKRLSHARYYDPIERKVSWDDDEI